MGAFDTKRFAVIADIHGNCDALSAVMADIAGQGIKGVVNLGDHFSGPLAASETADLLMAKDFVSIKGNHDRWLLEKPVSQMWRSDQLAIAQLSENHLEWLEKLPATTKLGDQVFACHGTPNDDNTYWLEALAGNGQIGLRPQDQIAQFAKGIEATLILCAHTHIPRRVDLPSGPTILNPGSVGCPAYDDTEPEAHIVQAATPTASYALVEHGPLGWITCHRNIPYDAARMIEMARAAGAEDWAQALSTGWFKAA